MCVVVYFGKTRTSYARRGDLGSRLVCTGRRRSNYFWKNCDRGVGRYCEGLLLTLIIQIFLLRNAKFVWYLKVWNYNGAELTVERTLLGHSLGVLSVRVDPSGKLFASSSLDSNISVWDLETGDKKKSIDSGPLESWTVEFTRDSKYILTGSADGKVEMFDVETGKKEKSLETKGKMALSLATSPDGK